MALLRRIHQIIGGRGLFLFGFVLFCGLFEYGRVMNLRPLPMHLWRQTDCLSLTTNYYNGRATFFSPEIHAQIADKGASGSSAGEFPVLYWAMGQVWKITGPSEFAYRLFGLLLHFLASYSLFLTLRRLLKSDFWSIGLTLLLFTSPVLVYYGISFLTDVPAFDLALIGWYFFVRHAQEGRRRYWMMAMACFALATLLKVTAGMSLVAIIGLYALYALKPSLFGDLRRVFPLSPVFGWSVISMALASIIAWYVHAEGYNELHNGRYTFNSLWPIWEMTNEEIDRAVIFAREVLVFQVFDTSVWLMITGAITLLMVHWRRVPAPLLLLNGMLVIGLVVYTVLWFHAVDGHDYYFVNPMIALLVPMVTGLWWLRNERADLFGASWVRWVFLFLLGYNAAYASNNLVMRSNPNSYLNRSDLLPTYHCAEPVYWNSLAYSTQSDLHDITPYLRSLGISVEDKVVSLDDPTINASLYFMDQRGFTQYGYAMDDPETMERCIALGAKYMVFVNEHWLDVPHMQPYLKYPLGQHRAARIYDLRNMDRRTETEVLFSQADGRTIPFDHRSSGTTCAEENSWCFDSNEYPLEINNIPLGDPAALHCEVIVRGVILWEEGYIGGSHLVMSENDAGGQINYLPRHLSKGAFEIIYAIPSRTDAIENKLFFWNKEGVPFRLDRFEIEVRRYFPGS